jgi:hypothetical protein
MIIYKKQIGGIILLVAVLAYFLSELFLVLEDDLSIQLKLVATALCVLAICIGRRFEKSLAIVPVILVFLAINYFRGAIEAAATEELMRYLLPILVLLALYANINSIDMLAKFFVWLVLSNDFYQVYVYFAYLSGLPVLIPLRFEAGYIIRAEGWVGFFSLFGFMNFCALMIVRYSGLYERRRTLLSVVFIVFSLLSTSLKLVFAYLMLAAFNLKKKLAPVLAVIFIIVATVFAYSQKDLTRTLIATIDSKLAFYVIQGNSARSESYRVMFESLVQPNFTGEGLGMFGGPASTKYGSPLYSKYNFDWYGSTLLATTDTFYPHLFVEMGLLGGLIYLLFLFRYGQKEITIPWLIIVIAYMADAMASFSILSIPYFLSAAICMLLFSRENINEKSSR